MRSASLTRVAVVFLLVLGLAEDLVIVLRPRAGLIGYYHDELAENPRYLDQAGVLAWGPVVLGVLVELSLALLAVVILVRAWRRREARALALFLALGGAGIPDGMGIPPELIEAFDYAIIVIGSGALLNFAMVFPEPVPADAPGWPPPRLRRLFQPWPLTALCAGGVLLTVLLGPTAWSALVAMTALISAAVMGAMTLRAGYQRVEPAQRRRVLWVLNGFYALSWMLVVAVPVAFAIYLTAELMENPRAAALADVGFQLFIAASLLLLPLFLGIGIFYGGAVDPRLAIRKTTVYGAMGVLTLTLFMVVEGTASMQVMSMLQLPSSVGPWVAGSSVALAFGPLQKWTSSLVERLIPATALAEGEREPAVVVFADICGYTRISATDESAALTLASLFHTTARRVAEQRGGRLVKTLGDGVVLEFTEAEPAVAAAAELRTRFIAAAEAMGFERPELRCGVHLGPVARGRDGDIFGAVVNLASRLEGAAEPGDLLASGAVAAALAGAARWSVEAAGERDLKNVPEPVATFRIRAAEPAAR
jgi:class 3 adenylate cyclase